MSDATDGYIAEIPSEDPQTEIVQFPGGSLMPQEEPMPPASDPTRPVITEAYAAAQDKPKTIFVPQPEGYRRANMVFKTGHNWPVDEAPEDLPQTIALFLEGNEPFLVLHDAKFGEPSSFPRRTIAEDLLCIGTTWVKEVHPQRQGEKDEDGKERVQRIWVPGVGYETHTSS